MKTLHSTMHNRITGQANRAATYKVQLNLVPELAERARKAKFLLEQHEGSSVSWSVFFFHALEALVADLKKRPAPRVDQLL